MEFTNSTLAGLTATIPSEPEVAAERANLCMEERVSAARQTAYENRVGAPDGWEDWQDNHLRYVQEEVRRRYPLSAALTGGEPSLRPGIWHRAKPVSLSRRAYRCTAQHIRHDDRRVRGSRTGQRMDLGPGRRPVG